MNFRFLQNVLLKGFALFFLINMAFIAVNPSWLGRLSLYNHIFNGRQRFPFGEDSSQTYNLSLFNLDAMFASHIISSGPKPENEYRVILVGDSSTWGTLLHPEETLAGQLDAAQLSRCGKTVRVYNLGYPTISLTKDLMVMDYALRYKPDLIIWLVSLEAFPVEKQLSSPIIINNSSRVDDLIARYNLPIDSKNTVLIRPGFWDRTLIGQRRALADLFRLQVYGVLWSATHIDQAYPDDFQRAQTNFNSDIAYHDMQPPKLDASTLAFGVLEAGRRIAGETPLILVNEPILISEGDNSDIRYNFMYPRWAYDQWREMMTALSDTSGWIYLDLWNIAQPGEFTNSAIHLSPTGERKLSQRVEQALHQQRCP